MSRRKTKEPYTLINKYVIRSKEITEVIYNKTVTHKYPVIKEQFTLPTGEIIEIPSILNKFTINKYRLKPYSSANNISTTIMQFMNFVKVQVANGEDELFDRLKEQGISGLNFYHLSSFLNYGAICGDSHKTFIQKQDRLFEFYKRLQAHKIINLKWTYKMIKDPEDSKRKRVYDYPFDKREYQLNPPSRYGNADDKVNDLNDEYIQLLLRKCKQKYPEILFGVALCMYGGIRQGELVNLRVDDIRLFKDKNIMLANIKDRQNLLFEGRSIAASGVKRKRRQVVFNDNGLLYEYYENHMKIRESIIDKKGLKSSALFLDRNGNAMTGLTYIQKFYKLKQKFLAELESIDYITYNDLCESPWGSHICRGIFTNLCVRRGYARTIDELMHLRGDTSTESSKPYWNQHTLSQATQRVIDIITSCGKYKDELKEEGAFCYG